MTKILLGILKKDAGTYADGKALYLEKHKWECGWYWAFGYIGNSNCHFHFNSLLKDNRYASEIFERTNITDNDWWVIRDLFIQSYALKKVAEVYQYGGHQTSRKGITDVLHNEEKGKEINKDLTQILDVLWDFCVNAIEHKGVVDNKD